MTTKAKPSSSTPQLSKSKARPQSASTRPRPNSAVKSKVLNLHIFSGLYVLIQENLIWSVSQICFFVYNTQVRSSMETPQYERKWATSSQTWSSITKSGDLRASSSLGLKSITRPASAKGKSTKNAHSPV